MLYVDLVSSQPPHLLAPLTSPKLSQALVRARMSSKHWSAQPDKITSVFDLQSHTSLANVPPPGTSLVCVYKLKSATAPTPLLHWTIELLHH